MNKTNRSPIIVALFISILLHQLILSMVGELWPEDETVRPEPSEIALVEIRQVKPPPDKKTPLIKSEAPASEPSKPNVRPPQLKRRPLEAEAKIATPPPEEPSITEPSGPEPQEVIAVPETKIRTDINWGDFERVFSAEAASDREAYAEASLEKRRRTGLYGRLSGKIKKALETNTGWVTPGNQEPLGDRSQIFHAYIYQIHEQFIHPLFADSFWNSLPSLGADHELNDWSLSAFAEFEIFANGSVSEVRIVRTSGNSVFDAAAVDSIYRSSPFPPPPHIILSWNDRVYLRWGFYRNHRKCGVFNVEPYILSAPGSNKEKVSIDEFIDEGG